MRPILLEDRPPMLTRPAPLSHLRVPVGAAGVATLAVVVWILAGDGLAGGRWTAIHLFTLGVATPLIATFSAHFATAVLHTAHPPSSRWVLVGSMAGAVGVLVGVPTATRWLVGVGATLVSAAILLAYVHLRRMRKRSLGARFAFVVRSYERAHGAFLHGALLGALMGTGVLPGAWYGGVRLAHLHINVLGFAGVTLLATVVFFGPTVFRVRIAAGAEGVAARALRLTATAVTVATLALVGIGLGGIAGTALRVIAGMALGAAAIGTARVVAPVVRVARGAKTSLSALLIRDACVWFTAGVALDAVVVGLGAWRWLDVVGIAILVGALGSAMLGAITYLGPLIWPRDPERRNILRQRIEAAPRLRAAVTRGGVLLLVVCAAAGTDAGAVGAVMVRLGWLTVIGSLLFQLASVAWPVRRPPTGGAGGPVAAEADAGPS